MKDAGQLATLGISVVAGATVAEFTCIVLLSLLFSSDATSTGAKVVLLVVFAVAALVIGVALSHYGDLPRISAVFTRLRDTTAQMRIRFAVLLAIAFAALSRRQRAEPALRAPAPDARRGR